MWKHEPDKGTSYISSPLERKYATSSFLILVFCASATPGSRASTPRTLGKLIGHRSQRQSMNVPVAFFSLCLNSPFEVETLIRSEKSGGIAPQLKR
jgi:hypothetical protein